MKGVCGGYLAQFTAHVSTKKISLLRDWLNNQGGILHNFSGHMLQRLSTLMMKKFLLIYSWNCLHCKL